MTKIIIRAVVWAVLLTTAAGGSIVLAQAPAAPARPPAVEKVLTPLKLQVILSRWEGEKKIANLPYTLWVIANDPNGTTLNVGIQVPIPGNTAGSRQYRNVGTNMVASATALDDGRFKIFLNIEDSSVVPSKNNDDNPSFQSLSTVNYLLLRDGQTAQYVAATDKITGQVSKVDVTVNVIK